MAHMRKSAPRADLVAELRNDVGYWGMVGNDTNITAAVDGAHALEAGAERVTVGHTVYEPSD